MRYLALKGEVCSRRSCFGCSRNNSILKDGVFFKFLDIKEFYKNALEIEEKGDFNSSVTLFFKALAVLADLYIYKKEGKIPSSHTERFRILEKKYNDIYTIIDKDFLAYQDSYRTQLNKEDCEVLKQDAEKLLGILGINK